MALSVLLYAYGCVSSICLGFAIIWGVAQTEIGREMMRSFERECARIAEVRPVRPSVVTVIDLRTGLPSTPLPPRPDPTEYPGAWPRSAVTFPRQI